MWTDVQRGAAGDRGPSAVGPEHLHVVQIPVRDPVPRHHRLPPGGRPLAGRAGVRRRQRRSSSSYDLSSPRQ